MTFKIFVIIFNLLVFTELIKSVVWKKSFVWWMKAIILDAIIVGLLYIPTHFIVKYW